MKRQRVQEDSDHSDSTEVQGASMADLYVMGLYQQGHSIKQPDCTAALTLINLSLSRPGPSAAELHDWFEDYDHGHSVNEAQSSESDIEADDREADDQRAATPVSATTAQSRLRSASPMKHPRDMPLHASPRAMPAAAAGVEEDQPAGWTQACVQCGSTDTPLWRTGPAGPKTLCNACGVKFSRHQHKGKVAPKHPAVKRVKISGSHQPGPDSGSPLV